MANAADGHDDSSAYLVEFSIEGLFGLFDHRVELDTRSGLTIICGPNGIGKTRILELLAALPRLRFDRFFSTPFRQFRLQYSDGHELIIQQTAGVRRREDPSTENSPLSLQLALRRSNRKIEELEILFPSAGRAREARRGRTQDPQFDRLLMRLDRLAALSTYGRQRADGGPAAEETRALETEYEQLATRYYQEQVGQGPIRSLVTSERTHLIDTLRLSTKGGGVEFDRRGVESAASVTQSVEAYSADLRNIYINEAAAYGRMSSSIDSSFKRRVIETLAEAAECSDDIVRSKFERVDELERRLAKAGVLAGEPDLELGPPESTPDDNTRRILALNAEDYEQKLRTLEPFLEKLEVLHSMFGKPGGRFLHKAIECGKDFGIRFRMEDQDQTVIRPSQLSSGEQHEVALAYELLFRVEDGTLVMVDEPELSLHVAWQRRFLRDLELIREVRKGVSFLIATHSPQIIHDRWDLTQVLGGLTEL